METISGALLSRVGWPGPSKFPGAVREARAVAEAIRYWRLSAKALTADLPRGDGRPILVIPGFLCSDASTWVLRRFLRRIGYTALAWKQGINWGPGPGVRTRLLHRLHQIQDAYEGPVTVIGWSLGGYYARELACIRPDLIREIITLGSPLHGKPESTAVWRAFQWLNRKHMPQLNRGEIDFLHPQVPCLSIYTGSDGIVPWQFCIPPRGCGGDRVEVDGSHIGLIVNPDVMRLLAERLGSRRAAVAPAARHRCRLRRRNRLEQWLGRYPMQRSLAGIGIGIGAAKYISFTGPVDRQAENQTAASRASQAGLDATAHRGTRQRRNR